MPCNSYHLLSVVNHLLGLVNSHPFSEFSVTAKYTRKDKSGWPADIMAIQLNVLEETDKRLHFKVSERLTV